MPSFKNFRRGLGVEKRRDDQHTLPPAPAADSTLTPEHLQRIRQLEEEGEPLSLAEELADLVDRGELDEADATVKRITSSNFHIAQLQRMTITQLTEVAKKENLADIAGLKKQDLIVRILKERVKLNGLMFGEGTLEILPDGFGFFAAPTITTFPALTISMSLLARFAGLGCEPE